MELSQSGSPQNKVAVNTQHAKTVPHVQQQAPSGNISGCCVDPSRSNGPLKSANPFHVTQQARDRSLCPVAIEASVIQ
jgi:hypothetical protein